MENDELKNKLKTFADIPDSDGSTINITISAMGSMDDLRPLDKLCLELSKAKRSPHIYKKFVNDFFDVISLEKIAYAIRVNLERAEENNKVVH